MRGLKAGAVARILHERGRVSIVDATGAACYQATGARHRRADVVNVVAAWKSTCFCAALLASRHFQPASGRSPGSVLFRPRVWRNR